MSAPTLPATRIERLFGKAGPTAAELKATSKFEDVVCPQCHGLMTLIKAPSAKSQKQEKGERVPFNTTTWQCHNPWKSVSGLCLTVTTVTDSVGYLMRPGDYDTGDIGWQAGVKDTIPEKDAQSLKPVVKKAVASKRTVFDGVKIKPEYPGSSMTVNKIAWDEFWNQILTNGKADKAKLEAYVKATARTNPVKVNKSLNTLRTWITERTGYAIKLDAGFYTVTGRTKGGKGPTALPYSDLAYQREHGFID